MFAIVQTGGKQYRVQPGQTLDVERLAGAPGESVTLGPVLMLGGDGSPARVGNPSIEGAVVRAEVLDHPRGPKIIVFRYKSKVRYRRKTGHRQALTRLRVTEIQSSRSASRVTQAPVAPTETTDPAAGYSTAAE